MDVVAEVVRSEFVESRHRGSAVRTDPSGDVVWAVGDPDLTIFPRSCNKPFQVVGMLQAGLPLDGKLLALASSSHSGEDFHLDGVRDILASAGLTESDLHTPASYPLSPSVHADWIRRGGGREPVCMDCSGKHAAMLATCVQNGWSVDDYLDPDHPLQQAILHTFTEMTGARPPVVGVDGCGAPLFATSVSRLARAAGALSSGPGRKLVDAAASWPLYLSGTGRTEVSIMEAIPGAFAKSGAEACFITALPDGSAIAVKIDDGSERAAAPVMARALELAGYDTGLALPPVYGAGRPVGQIQPAF